MHNLRSSRKIIWIDQEADHYQQTFSYLHVAAAGWLPVPQLTAMQYSHSDGAKTCSLTVWAMCEAGVRPPRALTLKLDDPRLDLRSTEQRSARWQHNFYMILKIWTRPFSM
eukprot:6205255-Pleurochrysis_carterae.AAC.1